MCRGVLVIATLPPHLDQLAGLAVEELDTFQRHPAAEDANGDGVGHGRPPSIRRNMFIVGQQSVRHGYQVSRYQSVAITNALSYLGPFCGSFDGCADSRLD